MDTTITVDSIINSTNNTMIATIGNSFRVGSNSRDDCKYFYTLSINNSNTFLPASITIPQSLKPILNSELIPAQDVTLCN